MKFRKLFESNDMMDLTHEIMIHHGLERIDQYEYHGPLKPELRQDLHQLGWRKIKPNPDDKYTYRIAHPYSSRYFIHSYYYGEDGDEHESYFPAHDHDGHAARLAGRASDDPPRRRGPW